MNRDGPPDAGAPFPGTTLGGPSPTPIRTDLPNRQVRIQPPSTPPPPNGRHDTADHGRAMMVGILGRRRRLDRDLRQMAAASTHDVGALLTRVEAVLPPEAEAMFESRGRDGVSGRISEKLVTFHVLAEAHARLAELEREVGRLRAGVDLLVADLGPDTVNNFVAGGARMVFIATHEPLNEGARLRVRLVLRGIGTIETEARVAWRRDPPDPGVGIELTNLEPRHRAAVSLVQQTRDPLPAAAARGTWR